MLNLLVTGYVMGLPSPITLIFVLRPWYKKNLQTNRTELADGPTVRLSVCPSVGLTAGLCFSFSLRAARVYANICIPFAFQKLKFLYLALFRIYYAICQGKI